MTEVRKITDLLSDGRELIYFDDPSTSLTPGRKKDQRQDKTRKSAGRIRFDPLTSEWVAIAPHRQARAFLPSLDQCPLCVSTEANLSEIPDKFDVAVFENRNPSFGQHFEKDVPHSPEDSVSQELAQERDAMGRCEVIVFSPDHTGSLGQLSTQRVRTVLEALADRTKELQKLNGVIQVCPFENRGQEVGVTLHHPHGQIYAYPFVTPRTQKLLQSIDTIGEAFYEDILSFESQSDRALFKGKFFTAYVPYAARWPIEIHVLPIRHVNHLGELSKDEMDELASVYKLLLTGLDMLYETPTPYIAAWHQAPLVDGGERVRLQLQITSPRRAETKLKYLAGSESAMGAFITDGTPEEMAKRIREVL